MEEIEVVNLQANKQNRQLSLLAFKSPVGNKTRATAPYTKYYLDPKPVALAEDYLEQRSGVARDRLGGTQSLSSAVFMHDEGSEKGGREQREMAETPINFHRGGWQGVGGVAGFDGIAFSGSRDSRAV
ncbi:mitochondrial metalloendopeptidase OMA1 [Physcia stellaris]|nr:mitochondrial metalloendopeptidase OMA1 [Physcia stellaris]